MPDLTNGTNGVTSSKPAQMQHIWVVTGPAGCGKSTVGNVLRTELGVPFLEGDDVSTSLYTTSHYTPSNHSIARNPNNPRKPTPEIYAND